MSSIADSEATPPPPVSDQCKNDQDDISDSCGASKTGSAALSKKKQKKANKVTQKIKVPDGSVDVMVQHTNDDSVVSKRSAVAHDYVRDRFLRHFVKKPSRRSPLINRGYYLRMAVMTDLVTRLAQTALAAPERAVTSTSATSPSGPAVPPVQVLSLGAGYDTLALRLLLDSVDVLSSDSGGFAAGATADAVLKPSSTTVSFAAGEVLFVDVDFPAVLQSKAALMSAAPPRSFPDDWTLTPSDADCPVASPFYAAVGVDLRTASAELLPRLHRFGPKGFSATSFTIIYAECVMQYMPAEDAAKLVELLAASFPNAVFLAYDQVSPFDSFGRVMQQSLRQKNSPLLGIQACPDGPHMTRRALASGMQRAWWGNFYRVSRYVIAGPEKTRVESLEAFDELEEWSEMCEHYGITMATTTGVWESVVSRGCAAHEAFVEYSSDGVPLPGMTSCDAASPSSPAAEVKATLHNWPSARYGFEGWGNGGVAVETLSNGDRLLVSFGGFAVGKQHQRVGTVYVHSLQEGELRVVVAGEEGRPPLLHGGDHGSFHSSITSAVAGGATATPRLPPALVFHSFSRIGIGQYLVWGGRTNPTSATADAYLLTLDIPRTVSLGGSVRARWTPLTASTADGCCCSPSARYRHTMVCLRSLEESNCAEAELLLMGGQGVAAPNKCSDELECFHVTVSPARATVAYEPLLNLTGGEAGAVPAAVHSAAALVLSPDEVLFSGGLFVNRDVCDASLWLLRLSSKQWTRLPVELHAGRFSHSLTRVGVNHHEYFLLLGGSTWEEKSSVPLGVLVPVEAVGGEGRAAPPVQTIRLSLPADAQWWSRHSAVALGEGVVGVVGGGYTCFSFGTFAAKPQLLHLGDCVAENAWRRVSTTVTTNCGKHVDGGCGGESGTLGACAAMYTFDQLLSKPWVAVREVTQYSAAAFLAVARAAAEPVVFRNVPLGPCVHQWASPAYLKSAEGNATVSVHVAEKSQLLDFVRKNFAFRHVTLAELVQHIEDATELYRTTKQTPAETWYYRSIAAHMKNERSNLWTDFATLGKDFVLPPGAKEYIEPRLHQSCLRMNAPPLQLWTHFDTLDNVLCQIVGSKRVVLFPPSEYNNLYMSGSSSAVINLDAPDLVRYPRFIQACKAAQEVILRPGDMLFFPAMWFHHITTLEEGDSGNELKVGPPYNISVNVFYRHFADASEYDTKDLYGNKDILAVTRLRSELQAAVHTLLQHARLHGTGREAKKNSCDEDPPPPLPSEYAEFALRQFLQDVEGVAADMSDARRASSASLDGDA
jgi:tRNA wybutosine-synthesizing protein 4